MIRNGSLPAATASGNAASGRSWDRSFLQAKNLTNGRRCKVIWSRIAPRKDRMACFERVENGAQRDWSLHLEQDLTVCARQRVLVI
jgi:hypothetical protein